MPQSRASEKNAISVAGLGYVGLSTAVCLATRGFVVYGVETDDRKRAKINSGSAPFREKGIDELLARAVRDKHLRCTGDYDEAIQNSDITFLTVGTPSRGDGSIDLRYVRSASESVGRVLRRKHRYHNVVVKSTVVPGTTQGLVREALERTSGKSCGTGFGLASNPEFLREGSAIEDTMNPDAIVIGALDKSSEKALLRLYSRFYGRKLPSIITTPSSAELIKYAVNSFRATQLSFLNTLANLTEKVPNADVGGVIEGLRVVTNLDERYLRPGLGFGGSCIPKDLRALIAHTKHLGVGSEVLQAALLVNENQPMWAIQMADKMVRGVNQKKVAVLGLAFKANTDDIRESVAVRVVSELVKKGAKVSVYDPTAMDNARRVLGGTVEYANTALECIEKADCCIIATEWKDFTKIPAKKFVELMKSPIIIDGKRVLDPSRFRKGITYAAIGHAGRQ